jgi:hypothetical protein
MRNFLPNPIVSPELRIANFQMLHVGWGACVLSRFDEATHTRVAIPDEQMGIALRIFWGQCYTMCGDVPTFLPQNKANAKSCVVVF